jgi:hypothetical protein
MSQAKLDFGNFLTSELKLVKQSMSQLEPNTGLTHLQQSNNSETIVSTKISNKLNGSSANLTKLFK